jgi:hypothetical protein
MSINNTNPKITGLWPIYYQETNEFTNKQGNITTTITKVKILGITISQTNTSNESIAECNGIWPFSYSEIDNKTIDSEKTSLFSKTKTHDKTREWTTTEKILGVQTRKREGYSILNSTG